MSKIEQCPICSPKEGEDCVLATVRTKVDGRTVVCCCETQAKKVKNE